MPPITGSDLSIEVTRYKDTIFIPLPRQAWQPCPNGQCCCDWCKAHPDCVPMWDTLVVGAKGEKRGKWDGTTMCHYPALANPLGKVEQLI